MKINEEDLIDLVGNKLYQFFQIDNELLARINASTNLINTFKLNRNQIEFLLNEIEIHFKVKFSISDISLLTLNVIFNEIINYRHIKIKNLVI